MGSEILAFGSQCSVNFQLILDCFIPNFKLKYDNLENIKTDFVNTVIFNLHEINLVHLGRFLHFSQKVVGLTLKGIRDFFSNPCLCYDHEALNFMG